MSKRFVTKLAGLTLAATITMAEIAHACTGIMLTGDDGTVVRARTMEWGAFDLDSSISLIPPGFAMSSTMPDGEAGAAWEVKYGHIAATALGRFLASDGLNTEGLSAGIFYLPGFASYPAFDPATRDVSLSPSDVVAYILGNFANVEETREAMETLRIVAVEEEALGFAAPVHYFVADATGEAIVIEVIDKEMTIHDADLGVITNAPAYDWHLTNLRNYLSLSATELATRTTKDGTEYAPLGHGTGMLGLPGDFTPPSRFVRAVAFTQSARETTGGYDTVREAFRILDNFNVPAEAVSGEGATTDALVLSATQYTSAVDMTGLKFYYHTQHNRRVRSVDLTEIDFAAMNGTPIMLDMDPVRAEDVQPVSFD